jgi:hypothetical protein
MIELVRSNDTVFLSWLTWRLAEEKVEATVFDSHMSILEGSVSALQRRVMISEGDVGRARMVLAEAVAL